MAKQVYEVDGEIVTSLPELADLLGVPKVVKKDLEPGGTLHGTVNILDAADADVVKGGAVAGDDNPLVKKTESKTDRVQAKKLKDMDDEEFEKPQMVQFVDPKDIDLSPDEIADTMPDFEDIEEFKEWYRDIDTPTVEYLARGLGVDWKPTEHENIHRMRISMAMQRHFFPEQFKPKEKKRKAKFGDYPTADLEMMLEDLNIEFKVTGHEAIDRMRMISKLKEHGALEEE